MRKKRQVEFLKGKQVGGKTSREGSSRGQIVENDVEMPYGSWELLALLFSLLPLERPNDKCVKKSFAIHIVIHNNTRTEKQILLSMSTHNK